MASPPASYAASSPASASAPATATAPPSSRSDSATPFSSSSSSSKYVSLYRWWLIKSDTDYAGKRLAVGGLTHVGKSMISRVFTSSPIVKQRIGGTLETADGFTVELQGCIDQNRTHENGIPHEVSQDFICGFPYDWEEYAAGDFKEMPTSPTESDTQLENLHDEVSKLVSDSSVPTERGDFKKQLVQHIFALTSQVCSRKSGVDNAGDSEGLVARKDSKECCANSMMEKRSNYSKDESIIGITDIDGLSTPSNDVNPYGTSGRSVQADKKKRPCSICMQPGHYRTNCQLAKKQRVTTKGVRVTRGTSVAKSYGTSGRSVQADKKKRPCSFCMQLGHYRTNCQLAKKHRVTKGARVTSVATSNQRC